MKSEDERMVVRSHLFSQQKTSERQLRDGTGIEIVEVMGVKEGSLVCGWGLS